MIFTYRIWTRFCKTLFENERISIPANEVKNFNKKYIILKHDVETNVKKALKMAKIEQKYFHRGVYYVQAYLLKSKKNIKLLKKIQALGHEVSYHYDVMDSCKGNIENAIIEFEKNVALFENNGFNIDTVCQHGNPLIKRIGYTSNRDFFRNNQVIKKFPNISDIMVNFKINMNTEFIYYSDAGMVYKKIYDPINNDVTNSEHLNVSFKTVDELINDVLIQDNVIISTHPHRWTANVIFYIVKNSIFKIVKFIVKVLYKIPIINKIIDKYYYLAKKL